MSLELTRVFDQMAGQRHTHLNTTTYLSVTWRVRCAMDPFSVS
jgi:hypothetical protein